MANEILFAGISDLRVSEVLSAEVLRVRADRHALPAHPALVYAGAASNGTETVRVPRIGLGGYDILSSTSDGSAVANTALTDASTDITVGRYSKAYEGSDLAFLTDPGNILSMQAFATDAVASASHTLVDLVATAGAGFTATAGPGTSTGNPLTYSHFLDAIGTLEAANVPGPYIAILSSRQWSDLRKDINTNSGGAIQMDSAARGPLIGVGSGYKGRFEGVDVFVSNRVPTDSGDYTGCMFGRGAIGWADGTIPVMDPARQMGLAGGKVLFEIERDAKSGLWSFVTHAYLGCVEMDDGAGCVLRSDA